jgi:hypothetical protein
MKTLPNEPTIGLLMSMALRYDHGLGMPGYYDQPFLKQDGVSHARRLESTISTMRQLYEEASGNGFYSPDKEPSYVNMYDLARATTPTQD